MIGSYIPMLKMPVGGDKCFVYAFNWGASVIDYFTYFDKAFKVDSAKGWVKFLGSLLFTTYDTYKMTKYCLKELASAKKFGEEPIFVEEWLESDVRVMAEKDGYPDIEAIIMTILALAFCAFKIYYFYKSEYYFWSFGFAIGKTAFMVLQAIELFGDVTILPNNRISYIENLSF